MKSIKSHLIVFVLALIIGAGLHKKLSKPEVITDTKTVTLTEKVVVQEPGKTTTIYRTQQQAEKKKTPVPPKMWRMSVLAEPGAPENWQLGVGYRVWRNVFVEGAVKPGRGEVMLGVSVEF